MADNVVIVDTKILDALIANSDKDARSVCKDFAFTLEGQIKAFANVDTSAMRNSVYTITQDEDHYSDAASAAQSVNPVAVTNPLPSPSGNTVAHVGPCVDYAIWQEIGTSRTAATHFVERAVESIRNRFNDGANWHKIFDRAERNAMNTEDWAI